MKKVRGNCEMDEQKTMTLCALISPRNIRRQVTVISQGSVLIAVWYLDKSTSEIGQQIIGHFHISFIVFVRFHKAIVLCSD